MPNLSKRLKSSVNVMIGFNFKTEIEDRGFVKAGDTFTYSIWARKSDEETLDIQALISAEATLNGEGGIPNRFLSTLKVMPDSIITTEWKRFYYTFTVPAERLAAQNGSITEFRIEQNRTSSEGCCVMWACPKLEKGNKLTDWSPAPEDANPSHYTKTETDAKIQVQSDRISSTVDKVTNIENDLEINERNTTSIIQDTRNLIFEALDQYVATGDLEEYKRIVSTRFEQTAKDFTFLFDNAISKINTLDGATQEEFEKWKKYIRFVDGNIVLGKVGNEITLNLENDILYFLQNNGRVAFLSNNKLYVTDGEFIKSLTVGRFGYKPRKNGSLTFGKIKKQ